MTIDDVSQELGRLAGAYDSLDDEFTEFKEEERRAHKAIEDKLNLLISDKDRRDGMLEEAKKTAKFWAAVVGALVAIFFDVIKHQVLGIGG